MLSSLYLVLSCGIGRYISFCFSIYSTKKAKGLNNAKKRPFRVYSWTLFLLNVLAFHSGILMMHPEIAFQKEFIDFIMYKEMGIPQGFVLIPLVGFIAYQQYNIEFIRTGLYLKAEPDKLWARHIIDRLNILIFALLIAILLIFIPFSETVILITVVILSGLYQVLLAFRSKPAR
jgi:hypothetical protein